MLYVIHMLDKNATETIRAHELLSHKAYLAAKSEHIAFAGPLLSDDGTTPVGSLLVIDFASRQEAVQWLANEPFTQAGVFAVTAVHAFNNLWPQKTGFPS